MDQREINLLSSVLHLPAGITIESAHPSPNELVLRVACCSPSMECPECHQPSVRIHGSYQRTVADVPCAGRWVEWFAHSPLSCFALLNRVEQGTGCSSCTLPPRPLRG
jgi:hypothetical protein